MPVTSQRGGDRPKAANTGRPTFVFAHANGFPPGCYTPLLTRLQPHGDVIAPAHRALWPAGGDTRNDPGDPALDLRGWRLFADDLIAALDLHADGPYVAVGHSLGAVTIAFAAELRPDLFERIVLIEPVFLPSEWIDAAAGLSLEQRLATPMAAAASRRREHFADQDSAWTSWRSKRVFSELDDASLRVLIEHALVPSNEGLTLAFPRAWEARIYAEPPNPWAMLSELNVETTAIRGSRSNTLLTTAWQRWQRLAPDARFIEVDGTHLVPLEQSDAVTEAIVCRD